MSTGVFSMKGSNGVSRTILVFLNRLIIVRRVDIFLHFYWTILLLHFYWTIVLSVRVRTGEDRVKRKSGVNNLRL